MPRPIDAKEVLEALRAEGAVEYGLNGITEIAAWFAKVGYGKAPSRRTLFRWRSQERCPFVVPKHRQPVWSTNLLLMSWAAARVRKQAKAQLERKSARRRDHKLSDQMMVAEAIRRKLIASQGAPQRVAQGTPLTPSHS